jgi:hypothetical protein
MMRALAIGWKSSFGEVLGGVNGGRQLVVRLRHLQSITKERHE